MDKSIIFIIIGIIVVAVILFCVIKFGIIDKKKENFDDELSESVDEDTDDFDEFIGDDIDDEEVEKAEENGEIDSSVIEDKTQESTDYESSDYSTSDRQGNGINKKLLKSIEQKIKNKLNQNDELGVVITNPEYAEYNGNSVQYSKKDLMDSALLLPGKVSDKLKQDFNLPPEAVKLDNNNLITVNKSIGVNTVGSSLRNASHDIRGDMLVGKSYQGPWNMSTIEADINNIGLANI